MGFGVFFETRVIMLMLVDRRAVLSAPWIRISGMFAAVCNIFSPFTVAFSSLCFLELFAFVADHFWEVRPKVEPMKGCTSSRGDKSFASFAFD